MLQRYSNPHKMIAWPLLAATALMLFLPFGSQAQKPFGGRILVVRPCNTGLLLTVGPPRGGEYMLLPGSSVYAFGVFKPATWVLGLAAALPVVCVLGKIPIGAGLRIIMVGTSL